MMKREPQSSNVRGVLVSGKMMRAAHGHLPGVRYKKTGGAGFTLHHLHHFVMASRWRDSFKSFYEATIASELAAVRMLDSLDAKARRAQVDNALRNGNSNDSSLDEVTAIIKTFERPACLERLIKSLRRFHPRLKLIVVDDSRESVELSEDDNIELVRLPYDSGVSLGRSEGLRRVETEYVLTLDDDFILYHQTRLADSLALLKRHQQIDIIGGCVIDLPLWRVFDYKNAGLHPTDKKSVLPKDSIVGDLPVFDKVPNFFIARTDRLRLVDWTPEIKRLDHADFFTRAKGTLLTTYNHRMKILHAKTLFDTAYLQKRYACAGDYEVLKQRWSVTK